MPVILDPAPIGKRIRETRLRRRLTRAQLAAAIDTSTAFVGYLERGEKLPSLETLARISQCLNVQMDFLVTGQAVTCDKCECPMFADFERWLERWRFLLRT